MSILSTTEGHAQFAGGGGGYGNPKRRARQILRTEVRDGTISAEAARDVYGLDD